MPWCAPTACCWPAIRRQVATCSSSARPAHVAPVDRPAAYSSGLYLGQLARSTASTAASASASSPGYPVYALAGIETSAIRAEWLSDGRRPSGLRPAGDAAVVLHAVGGVAAHPAPARRGRTPRSRRGRAAAIAAAGSDRPIDRRRRPRFQQSADDRQRHGAAAAPPHQPATSRRNCSTPSPTRPARRKPDPAIAGILAAADAAAERDRSRRAAAGNQGDAQPLAARRHRNQRRRAEARMHGQGRSERVRTGAAQSRGQRPRRHAVRRHADHHRQAGGDPRQGQRRGADRRIHRDPRSRYRNRHSDRCVAAGIRAVFHHQGRRQGHRPWAEPGLRLRPAIGRRRGHRRVRRGAARPSRCFCRGPGRRRPNGDARRAQRAAKRPGGTVLLVEDNAEVAEVGRIISNSSATGQTSGERAGRPRS